MFRGPISEETSTERTENLEGVMYWEQDKECMDREDLEQLQLERLESTLTRVQMNVPFYRKKFDDLEIDTDTIRSLDDLRRLPFTTKDDLRNNYPYGMFAVPLREVVRVHASSGIPRMILSRSPLAMVSLPEDLAFTMALNESVHLLFRFRAVIRRDRL
jgi:hypothetical protein